MRLPVRKLGQPGIRNLPDCPDLLPNGPLRLESSIAAWAKDYSWQQVCFHDLPPTRLVYRAGFMDQVVI